MDPTHPDSDPDPQHCAELISNKAENVSYKIMCLWCIHKNHRSINRYFRLFRAISQCKVCLTLNYCSPVSIFIIILFEKSKLLQSVLEQVCVTPDEHFILFLSCDLSSRRESLAVYHLNKGLLLFR
jgi:hypothetical protein